MNAPHKSAKPREIVKAEYALITWTAWTCIYGIYDAWVTIPQVQSLVSGQLQGQMPAMLNLPPNELMKATVGYYALVALVSVFFILMIGKGKRWARSSFLWGFIFEVLSSGAWMALAVSSGTPPTFMDWASYVPDLGLQIYALCMLYLPPGHLWFERRPVATKTGPT